MERRTWGFLLVFILGMILSLCKNESVSRAVEVSPDAEWKQNPTGSAGILEGKSVLISIYIEDTKTRWSENDKNEASKKLMSASRYIKKQAKKYGKNVTIIADRKKYKDICYDYQTKWKIKDSNKSQMKLYKEMKKFIENDMDVTAIREKYGTDSMGFLFHVNKSGVSSTMVHYIQDGTKYFYECATLFSEYQKEPEGASTYAHEILHLFGARDLYEKSLPDGILSSFVKYVETKFPNDIMYSTYTMSGKQLKYKIKNEISRITAYFLGWRDSIPEKKKYALPDMSGIKGCFSDGTDF